MSEDVNIDYFNNLIEIECCVCEKPMLASTNYEEVECQNCYITKLELIEKEKKDKVAK